MIKEFKIEDKVMTNPIVQTSNRIVRIGGNNVNIYIREDIRDFSQYVEIIEGIHSLGEDDEVKIYLNSPGGRLDVTAEICDAIKNSPAHFTAVPIFHNASASTIIALSCDEMVVDEVKTSFMIHAASFGHWGTHGNIKTWTNFFPEHLAYYIREVYRDFLSEEEIETILENREIYLNGREILERWEHRQEVRQYEEMERGMENLRHTINSLIATYVEEAPNKLEITLPEGFRRSQIKINEIK